MSGAAWLALGLWLAATNSTAPDESGLTTPVPSSLLTPTRQTLNLSLAEAVALALRHNVNVRLANVQRVAERFALYVSRDKFKPHASLNLSAGPTYALGNAATAALEAQPWGSQWQVTPHLEWLWPSGTLWTADLSESLSTNAFGTSNSATLVLGVRQPWLKNLGLSNNLASWRLATWQEGINKMQLKATLLTVVSQVSFAFRALTQADLLRSIAQKAVERARQVLAANQQMLLAGRIARADLLQVEADIASREATLANADNDFIAAQVALLQLLTLSPATPVLPQREALQEQPLANLEQTCTAALRYRPDYQTALCNVETAQQQLIMAQNNRRWQLDGLAQFQRTAPTNAAWGLLQGPPAPATQVAFVGLQLTVPLVAITLEQQVVNQQVALEQARLSLQSLDSNIRASIDGALRSVSLQQRAYRLSARARDLANKTLENEQEKLRFGRSSTFVVLRFVDNLVNAESAEIQAQIAFLNALTAVELQSGTLLEHYAVALQ